MNNDFKLLSLKEEKQLSTTELKNYYNELKQFLIDRKLTNTTKGAEFVGPKLKLFTNKIAKNLTKIISGKDVEIVSDGQENIPEGPVIFAHTHQGLLDNFAWISETPKHSIILHSSVVKKFLVLIQMNTGLVLVKKDDKENRKNAKLDMIELLNKGNSISYFPESAWNLSPNKLHLPLNFGFLDVAKKASVPVVPVVDEYTYDSSTEKERITRIHIKFGKPIYVNIDDDLQQKLLEYEEQISTMRWDLISEKGLYKRSDISNLEYINYLKGNLNNLRLGGIDINIERKNIWNANDEFYKFNFINDVEFDEDGNFLETSEKRRLALINKKHNI